jgi:hypothetical protein
MPLLLAGLDDVYVALHRRYDLPFAQLTLLRFSCSFMILLVPVPGRYNVQRRASHVLPADSVMGPYRPMNDALYLPGTMEMIRLAPDLSRSIGEPRRP